MGYPLQVFVSSACYELRDLRASIKGWLHEHGLTPMMSDDPGFPHIAGMPPYATCLKVLEECPLVIGVIDRHYGRPFEDWDPYKQFNGCAPTHAELRHSMDMGKRVLVYVHNDLWCFYEAWNKNPSAMKDSLPQGLDEATLLMFQELKQRTPAPWIEHFSNVTDILASLNKELVNLLYMHFQDREKQTMDLATYLLDKITEAAPNIREKIISGLNPDLVIDRESLQRQLIGIQDELEKMKGETSERISTLEIEKSTAQSRLGVVEQQLSRASLFLAQSAMKDVSWLDFIRRTMMPKQPGRVPFHHSIEVALRGFKTAGGRQKPVLEKVTWSKLPYNEGILQRGYEAGIIFTGCGFTPGITWTYRRRGELIPPPGNTDYFWHLPGVYFGDYLEVSSGGDEVEAPLSWRDYEFQVRNPEGERSDWVIFSYQFDDELIKNIQSDSFRQGDRLLRAGKAGEAIEPLRKAYVFSDRFLGIEHAETLKSKALWEQARNEAALAKLRFRVGDQVTITSGPHTGGSGKIEKLLLNHLHAYVIKLCDGSVVQASDEQVGHYRSTV